MDKNICFKNCVTSSQPFNNWSFCPATMWGSNYLGPFSKKIYELKEVPKECPFKLEHIISNKT